MINTRKPGKKRIMVQLWGAIAEAIERDFKSLHIKRDSYLNDLLGQEIENLASEVTFRNLDEVRERIQNRKLPDRKKLTLELDEAVVKRIDEVLKEKNIYRDSFVNRVLFFLVANESHLNYLDIDYERKSQVSAKPLADASYLLSDPFFHIRSCNENKFYTLSRFQDGPFGTNGSNLFALNVVISDEDWKLMKSIEDFGVNVFL
jgi:hypothetical protein